MREAQFLKHNAEKWKQFEQEVHQVEDPDKFADHFIELTDDLAYARTFYPNSNTTRYLNGIASVFHQKIYKNKREKSSRIFNFWRFELPFLFRNYQKQLLYSFLFSLVFCLIGILSAKYDDSFIRVILGNGYVNMTNENIANGDPFGVYKQGNPVWMFLMIAFNNIRVSFTAFVTGIFFGIGTVLLLLYNGLMLGSFEYYFFSKGIGMKSIMVIFIHGTLEISAIIIAGCSGLIVGSSILFPGTFTRSHSIVTKGRDAMKIVFGLVPIFLVAAFLESFVTRHTEMPFWLSLSILSLSFLFIVWYFIIYPIQLNRVVERAMRSGIQHENQNFQQWISKKLSSEK